MKKYHKINGLYKRDEKGRFISEFSTPEFEYLFDNLWIGTEKIDGTNIRILWDKGNIEIKGRNDNSDIPEHLLKKLNQICERIDFKETLGMENSVILYGEGYGYKIQKGGDYIQDGVDFIVFDILINDWVMKREDVIELSTKMGLKSVPVVFKGSLKQAEEMVKNGFKSSIGKAQAEGLVLTPMIELKTRMGTRVITKLKTKDYNKEEA